jgi:hypothetical protein
LRVLRVERGDRNARERANDVATGEAYPGNVARYAVPVRVWPGVTA